MAVQTVKLAGKRFVIVPEKDYQNLKKRANGATLKRQRTSSKKLDEATLIAIDEAEDQIVTGRHHDWKKVSGELRAKYLGK